jgi:hypothetical protein
MASPNQSYSSCAAASSTSTSSSSSSSSSEEDIRRECLNEGSRPMVMHGGKPNVPNYQRRNQNYKTVASPASKKVVIHQQKSYMNDDFEMGRHRQATEVKQIPGQIKNLRRGSVCSNRYCSQDSFRYRKIDELFDKSANVNANFVKENEKIVANKQK